MLEKHYSKSKIADVVRDIGEDKLETMESMERFVLLSKKSDAYENEFEEHGLEYLAITRARFSKTHNSGDYYYNHPLYL